MLLLFSGCDSDGALHPTESDEPDLPSPYLVDDSGTGPVATLAPEQVAAGLESAVAEVLGLDPVLIFDAQSALLAAADGSCPYVYDDYVALYGYYYWYDTCDTSEGASFDGYSYYYDILDADYGGYTYNAYHYFYGLADMSTPAGERYEQTGYAYYYDIDYTDSGYRWFAWVLQGDFVWTGPSFGDSWLGADLSFTFDGSAYRYASGGTVFSMNGTVGGLSGEFDSVSFDQLFAMDAAAGGDCDEPGGRISVRDASGEWYDVEFQGPAWWGAQTFPPECDGCGEVYHRGDHLGQACPDLRGILAWQGRPWS